MVASGEGLLSWCSAWVTFERRMVGACMYVFVWFVLRFI